MADFKVQRGQATIASGATSVTLTAGTDYTAPASASSAFVRITNTARTGSGTGSGDNDNMEEWTVYVDDASAITSQIDFVRYASPTESVDIEWEIIEYVGAGGGSNEFVVRHVEAVADSTAGTTWDSSTVSGVSDDNDVVVFLTGHAIDRAIPNLPDGGLYTTEWVSASNVARLERITTTTDPHTGSVAVVEFTGSNWSVQRVEHTYSAAGATETETITAVGSLSKTFTHPQLRASGSGIDESGHEVWLSATDTASFLLESGAGVNHVAVLWIIENTQSGGTTDMTVNRYSGSRGSNSNIPDTWTETITAVSALSESSIMGESLRSSGAGGYTVRASTGLRLTATDTVTLQQSEGGQTQTYRFEVVEWPEESGGGGGTTHGPLAAYYRRLRQG